MLLLEMRQAPRVTAFETWGDFLMAWLDRRPADMLAALSAVSSLTIHDDPEFVFRVGWLLCDVGEHEQGLQSPSASNHQGVLCGLDSLGQSVVRSIEERATLPSDPG